MTLKAGWLKPNNELTSDSMAFAIERALEDLVPLGVKEDPLGRRKLALAIARGVLQHLQANIHSSLHTTVPNHAGSIGTHDEPPTISVDLGGWS